MNSTDYLTIALLQTEITWENKANNFCHIQNLLAGVPGDTQLAVLPEMFSTGFSKQSGLLAEDTAGETVRWMQKTAGEFQLVLAGSLMIYSDGKIWNRFIFAFPNGKIDYSDKRHIFSMGFENKSFTSGTERRIVVVNGFRILPQICYDLRFPVFSRNQGDYDILLNCANWPAPRAEVWNILLKARAIENQAYVAGVNRTGTDGNGIRYNGGSRLLDSRGNDMVTPVEGEETILTARLSKPSLIRFRQKFPVLGDQDKFLLS